MKNRERAFVLFFSYKNQKKNCYFQRLIISKTHTHPHTCKKKDKQSQANQILKLEPKKKEELGKNCSLRPKFKLKKKYKKKKPIKLIKV